MSIYEYNEEYVKRTLLEDGMKAGYDKGKAEGFLEGKAEGKSEGKAETLVKSVEAVMKSLQTDAVKACEILGISLAEYEKAKADKLNN